MNENEARGISQSTAIPSSVQPEQAVAMNVSDRPITNAMGETIIIDSGRIYTWSNARKLILLSDDKLKRACKRNGIRLLRKPYAFRSDIPDKVKSYMLGIRGSDLITVAQDDLTNPSWEEIPEDNLERDSSA